MRFSIKGSKPGPNSNQQATDPREGDTTSSVVPSELQLKADGTPATTTGLGTAGNAADVEKGIDAQQPHNDALSRASSGDGVEEVQGDGIDYPEGGLEAWTVTFGAWCAMGMLCY